ncbi:ABC transporter ATP-binding protein [Seohaeicola saemankumensis]|nr:ABC transporter ATP-binding protein [Seohaeicola saemankumensis]MCA0869613.1 ABC transporter ATP-binding protein [Seohaeicola saemankumensis]
MLDLSNLRVTFTTRKGPVAAVRDVSLHVAKGEALGIVGESGSGKSVTCYALMRILDRGGRITAGGVSYSGIDLCAASDRDMQDIRGREISMIFQNPRAALNPIRTVGAQIEDVLRRHAQATRQDAREKAIEALKMVRIKDAEARYHAYPFELSGGMCQRVVIAIALACNPRLLIADEPTTGLDITTQKTVMDLIRDLSVERGMSSVLITHDLGLAAEYCDRIVVMKDGELVEEGAPGQLFSAARHPYTRRLIAATPRQGATIRDLLPVEARGPLRKTDTEGAPLVQVRDLVKTYEGKSGPVRAVDGISFDIPKGASLALVGESGCGKSTTSSMLTRLLDPTSGRILFEGDDLGAIPARDFARNPRRRDIQMVFQDATDSLNPRHTAAQSIAAPLSGILRISRAEVRKRVDELAEQVGLPHSLLHRFPHQLSGGQKARVGIARAIAVQPKLLILDEPTAALDVSIQAVVLNLLADLRAELGMTYLFVSHDLQVVRMLCDHVLVMQGGKIVEEGSCEAVMTTPTHPMTQALLAATPRLPETAFQDTTMNTQGVAQ